ncbi:MAG: alpha/beta fold hydrolase [Chroococcales cyanobacterium]
MTKELIEVESLKWFYREVTPIGNSEKLPVVLLHGLPSQSFSWCEIMPALAEKGFRAIAPDWIGLGFSGKPDKRDFAYTPDAYIDALANFFQTLALNKFHLVVQGFLGSVGLQYALRYPEQIERLVILNTPLSPAAKLPWKMKQLGLPLIGDMLTQDPLLVDRTLEGGSGFQIADENLDVYRKPFLLSSDAGRSLLAILKNLQLPKALSEIESGLRNTSIPTQIIWGMADPWLSATDAETLAQANTNIELESLPEAKHYPQEHWPDEIKDSLLNFLRREIL